MRILEYSEKGERFAKLLEQSDPMRTSADCDSLDNSNLLAFRSNMVRRGEHLRMPESVLHRLLESNISKGN